jgi:hypothetical protein
MKRIKTPLFIVGMIAFAAIVLVGTYKLSDKYLPTARSASPTPVACTGTHASYQVIIKDNAVQPEHTSGKLCDTLTITNTDSTDMLVAFGPTTTMCHTMGSARSSCTETIVSPSP